MSEELQDPDHNPSLSTMERVVVQLSFRSLPFAGCWLNHSEVSISRVNKLFLKLGLCIQRYRKLRIIPDRYQDSIWRLRLGTVMDSAGV